MRYISRILSVAIVSILCLASSELNAHGQSPNPADLDRTFNGTGSVTMTGFGIYTSALQADGKIVVGGFSQNPAGFAAIRFNPNGSLDMTFGGGTGRVVTTGLNQMRAIAIQGDGKIVGVGETFVNGGQDLAAVRYWPDGTLDTTFGSGGRVVIALSSTSSDGAYGLAFQGDGKIVICGYVLNPSTATDFAVIRLNENGSPDTSFDSDGIVTTHINSSDTGRAVVVQGDGKILVTGSSHEGGGGGRIAVARYNQNGSLDSSFDLDGIVTTEMGDGGSVSFSIKVQANQKVVVAGSALEFRNGFFYNVFGIVRYNTNGSLDNSFDGDGKVTTSFLSNNPAVTHAIAESLVIKPTGKLVVGGFVILATQAERKFAVATYNSNGSLDTSFNNNGQKTFNIGTSNQAYSINLQRDGKIVGAGRNVNALGEEGFAIFRLQGEPFRSQIVDFDGDGKTDVSIFRPGNGEWWWARSSDSVTAALQFGVGTDVVAPGDFTGDGKLDHAVWRPSNGFWYVLRSEDFSFYALPFGLNGDVPVTGDYDADGKADVAVFRRSNSTWFIARSTDGGTSIIQFGIAGDVPVNSDYDGDGRHDIAIYRPGGQFGGEWWINRSTQGLLSLQFGAATDKTVPADYTGDGKTDIAFWRPNTGEWYIIRSENFSFYAVPFGQNGDIPAPGDYDGDSKVDQAIFRPSQALWFIARSTGGTDIFPFGLTGDRPIPNSFVR